MANKIPNTISDILSPLTPDDFLQQYYGRNFVHLPGTPEKFEGLFPWTYLNHVLEYHRLSPVRLRLFKDGESIKPRMYAQIHENREPEIRVHDFLQHLRDGATLILDDAEELYPPLRALAVSLERLFRVKIQVNLYAGWQKNRGFDLHWDDHDVFVLQVAGRKQWAIHSPTRPHPLRPDTEEAPAPSAKPTWESVLQEGDLLYLPRGWWHMARPLGEPCLHLTIGLNNPTGLDLLHWFVKSLRDFPEVRQDLPHLGSPAEKANYLEHLKQAMSKAWKTDLLDRFMGESDERAVPRPTAQLPQAATNERAPLSMSTRVRIAAPRKIALTDSEADGVFRVRCIGKEWRCPRLLFPVLQRLNDDGAFHSREELLGILTDKVDRTAVEDFIGDLIRQGLLVAEDSNNDILAIR